MNNIITTPPSWQELHDISIQLRKDYDDLHKAYLEQIEATDSAREIIEEDASILISLQNAGHSGDATKVLTAFHHSKQWLLHTSPKDGE
jgi:hypothetical protein